MPIHLKVEPELDSRAAQVAADKIQARFKDAGRDTGVVFGQELSASMSTHLASANVQRDLQNSLNTISKHGDAAGKEFAANMAARMNIDLVNAGRSHGTAYANAFNSALGGVASQFGVSGSAAENAFGKITSGAGLTALAVGGIGIAAIGVGTELYNLGAEWDTITDRITGKTGIVGTELDKITESIKNVGIHSSASLTDIGDVAGDLVQALHLSGKPLEDLTKSITDLHELTGEKLNVRDLAKVFHGFGIEAGDMGPTLDRLYDVFTNTGIPVSELIASLKQVGPTAREISPDIGVAAGLLVTLEEAGINGETAFTGLKIAMGNLSKEKPPKGPLGDFLKDEQGKDLNTKIADLITKIHETGNIDLAKSAFGKSWQPIFETITNGKLTVDDLNKSVDNTGHTIGNSKKATDDWVEEFKIMKNNLVTELEPAAKVVFSGISNMITQYLINPFHQLNDLISGAGSLWRDLFGGGGGGGGTPGAPGVPGSLGTGPGSAIQPPGAIQGPGIPQTGSAPGTYGQGQNPLGVFAPTGGDHPGPPQLGGGGNSLPGAQGAVYNAMTQAGFPASEWGSLNQIITHESGWNPGARNPGSGAFGLFQFLGHQGDKYASGYSADPGTQASAGMQYIRDRYGSPSAAWAFWQAHNWYAAGGDVQGPGGADNVPAWLTAGEFVVNKDAAAEHGALLDVINSGGAMPLADPRGSDPKGGPNNEPSLGPFAPWWDMDWLPPKHPERIGETPGGKWWHRGPTVVPGTGSGKWRFPPEGKFRPLLPGIEAPPDGRIKAWGYQTGGPVIDPMAPAPAPAPTPDIGQQAAQSFFGGLQQGGGLGGIIGGFGNMALNAAQQAGQQESSVQPGQQPSGKGGGSSQSGAGGALGMVAGMFPGGQVASALAMRTAKFGGQLMSIGIMGAMETFLPGGTDLSDPSKSLVGRIASGIAGGQPASKNMAAQAKPPPQAPPPPMGSPASGRGSGPAPGPAPMVVMNQPVFQNGTDGEAVARDIARQQRSYTAGDNSR